VRRQRPLLARQLAFQVTLSATGSIVESVVTDDAPFTCGFAGSLWVTGAANWIGRGSRVAGADRLSRTGNLRIRGGNQI
jgi:hypothetical protein